MQSSIDPIPSVNEAEATGEIAELYADIRQTLGMSFVNLIWRNIATIPTGLRWTWQTIKPLYANGAVYSQAQALRDAQDLPPIPRFSEAVLRSVGIDTDEQAAIRATLLAYDHGNALNIVSISAVVSRLNGETPPRCPEVARQGVQPSPPATPVPTMLSLDQMPSHVAELVQTVNLIGARGKARDVQVSLPKNLAHWPGFLALYFSALQPLHDDGTLFAVIDAVIQDARRRGHEISGALGHTGLPDPETATAVKAALENFIQNAIGRMIPVVNLLLRMMPPEAASAPSQLA